ncbi:MAG: CoA transferase [Deltaproteobacteria bacterium]
MDPRPLSGITVLDLTRVLAGPYCTMVLGHLGARVIKIEGPGHAQDAARTLGPFIGGKSLYYAGLNYDKESIVLDLKKDEDKAIFDKLLGEADVLVENYRPGVMERLGYGYDALRQKHPKLIYAAASGFGHTGPMSQRPAYDMVVQAMSGLMSLTGPLGGDPVRVGVSVGDIVAGLFLTIGISSALYKRIETGHGMKIDVAMLDAQVAILENALTRHLATGEVPGPLGTRHPNIAPFQAFHAKEGQLVVCAGHDELYWDFCDAIGRADLKDDPRFLSADQRRENVDALEAEIETTFASADAAHWLQVLEEAKVPVSPINTVADVAKLDQVAARHMIRSLTDPKIGTLRIPGNPIKMSGVPEPESHRAAPELDEDRALILAWLG